MTDLEQAAELRREALAARNAEHRPDWYLEVSEAECADIASGFVPTSVRAMARYLLEQAEMDEQRAVRPVRKATKGAA